MKNFSKKVSVFSISLLAGCALISSSVSALEILANNYSMNATETNMTAQALCETAGLVSTDPTESVSWSCSSADLDTTQAGRYIINIHAEDASDGSTKDKAIQIKVNAVVENTAPELLLKTNSVSIEKGNKITLKDYIASAKDVEDGDISNRVEISGDVDVNKAGKYVVTYRVYDNGGLEDVKTLAVTVTEPVKTTEPTTQPTTKPNDNKSESNVGNTTTTTTTQKPITTTTAKTDKNTDSDKALPSTSDMTSAIISGLAIIAVGGIAVIRKRKITE